MSNDVDRPPTTDPGVLGCYVLPGGVSDPTVAFAEARAAAEIGLGTVWLRAGETVTYDGPAGRFPLLRLPQRPSQDDEQTGLAIGARAAGYFHVPGLGDSLVTANRWNTADLAKYRAHPTLVGLGDKTADKHLPRPELVELSRTLPAGWLASSSAAGSATECAAVLRSYIEAGADELILHGSTAPHLGSLVEAFRR